MQCLFPIETYVFRTKKYPVETRNILHFYLCIIITFFFPESVALVPRYVFSFCIPATEQAEESTDCFVTESSTRHKQCVYERYQCEEM